MHAPGTPGGRPEHVRGSQGPLPAEIDRYQSVHKKFTKIRKSVIFKKRACGPAFVEFGQIDIHSSVDLGWKPPTTQPLCLLTILEVGVFADARHSWTGTISWPGARGWWLAWALCTDFTSINSLWYSRLQWFRIQSAQWIIVTMTQYNNNYGWLYMFVYPCMMKGSVLLLRLSITFAILIVRLCNEHKTLF